MPQHDILFSYDFPPIGGGIARMMAALAQWYPEGSLLVSTGTMPGSELVDAELHGRVDRLRVRSTRLKTFQGRNLWIHRGVRLAGNPDARFAWCGTMRPDGYPAHAAWRRHRLPYGICCYGGDLLHLREKLARSARSRRVARKLLGDAAVLVAISRWTATQLGSILHQLRMESLCDRIAVVPLGTDPDRFRPDSAAAERFRCERGLPQGRWLVTVARLVPHKGVDTAIDALALLGVAYPELHYAVIGQGPYGDELRARAARLGIGDRVHFLARVTDAELPAAYAMADIYLGLSRIAAFEAEGFGIALLEAAAAGVPVVAGASGGIGDAVADGETGVMVQPDDAVAAAAAIRSLLDDPAQARQLGAAGRERVLGDFTWQRVAADFHRLAGEHGRR